MVPKGWKIQTIEDLAKISSGGTPSRNIPEYWGGEIPWVTTTEVCFSEILTTAQKITQLGLEKSSAKLFPPGTLLVAMYGQGKTRGQVAKLGIEATTNQACAAIMLKAGYSVEYYFQYLQAHYEALRNLSNGGSQDNLSAGILKTFKVTVPPLSEQKKIAQILSTWDKAIETTEQLLRNSQQQKKALMQQLLTGKKRFPGFKGKWAEMPFSQIVLINPKKPFCPVDSLVSFIPMDAVSNDAKLLRTEAKPYTEVNVGFTSFENDDVLVAKITPCFENGKGAYVKKLTNGIGFGSTEFHVLRAKDGYSSKFIYQMTITKEFRVKGEANMQGSAGQKRVTADYLRSYKTRLPICLQEQDKIASILEIADREIEALRKKIQALKQEKKALMQVLLTGKKRVKM